MGQIEIIPLKIMVFFAVAGLVFSISPSSQANQQCSILLQSLAADIKYDIEAFKSEISKIPTDVLSGKNTPEWNDFNQLKVALEILKKVKPSVDPYLSENIGLIAKERQTGTLSEYEIKTAFQLFARSLNRELPRELRFPIANNHSEQRRRYINEAARRIISETLEPNFKKLFPTTGYADYAAYETAIRSSKDPTVIKALEMIDNNQIEVIIRAPSEKRLWIPDGFKNLFVTEKSGGWTFLSDRNIMENKLFGYDSTHLEQYKNLDPEIKPKYGTIRASKESRVRNDLDSTWQYGDDIYVFKTQNIKDRLSFFADDSLGYQGQVDSWKHSFIPWSYRLLMIPHLLDGLRKMKIDSPSVVDFEPPFKLDDYRYAGRYWETHITGSISFKDVSAFEFTREPPSGDFLRQLKQHNIKILDGRQQPSVEWKEETSSP